MTGMSRLRNFRSGIIPWEGWHPGTTFGKCSSSEKTPEILDAIHRIYGEHRWAAESQYNSHHRRGIIPLENGSALNHVRARPP
jgi:hypothetical protein